MAKKHLTDLEWELRLNEVSVSKDDLNRLVMDYLVIEGYKDAAQCFSNETGLSPQVDLESIQNRMTIRAAIQRGDIEDAIGRVNELDPEILDTNPLLFFHLQQQRLIELIRAGNIREALQFASEELAPRGEEFPHLLPELERTMALIAFDLPASDGQAAGALIAPPHISELLSPSQKLKTAAELNAAILASQSQGCDPKLPQMLRLMTHGEALLGPNGPGKIAFPRLGLAQALGSSAMRSSDLVAQASSAQDNRLPIVAMSE
ncbi:unnamed protein product [Parajaminaea phylloscopi]